MRDFKSLASVPPVLQDTFDAVTLLQIEDAARRLRVSFPEEYVEFLCGHNGGCFAQLASAGTTGSTHVRSFFAIGASSIDFELEHWITANRHKSGRGYLTIGSSDLGELILVRNSKSYETPVVALDSFTNERETVAGSLREFVESIEYSPRQAELWTETETPFTFVERGEVSSIAKYEGVLSMKSKFGQSALGCASASLQPRVVELLVEMGADLDEVDSDGMTPLMLAARNGGVEICQTLLKCGANASLKNSDGMTALDLAIEDDVWRVKELLLAFNRPPRQST